jgi:hypothetical protein
MLQNDTGHDDAPEPFCPIARETHLNPCALKSERDFSVMHHTQRDSEVRSVITSADVVFFDLFRRSADSASADSRRRNLHLAPPAKDR